MESAYVVWQELLGDNPEIRLSICMLACSEIKERMKKQKTDKAALKAADNKKLGGKAQKNVQSYSKGAAKNFKR